MTDLHRTAWNGLGLEPRGYDEQTMIADMVECHSLDAAENPSK